MARTIPIERRSLATQVANALRELIMSNTYRQGQQLRQDDLAKRLGVSRVRDDLINHLKRHPPE
jgi:DNA-binding GntR family transcriptional regulator